ncbi:hypothetical protein TpMuguga_04g00746 [Theileria parva strain Muguga]|uniref:F-box domain-containing protein n=1 Tax=Theileria parva TaxID=5875 RepID=Q4N1J3_THEPA|nr:uncharacterized protein TpMuguga_04g00746 [Theileria parva strain Muguga]EAN32099.1 hypothetical protein TpMuguga_04g00746 [Theileria parva strain Muguga]|eukprot:XP_764382.1 hypothetical protein [Theileria parva strain Muguga]
MSLCDVESENLAEITQEFSAFELLWSLLTQNRDLLYDLSDLVHYSKVNNIIQQKNAQNKRKKPSNAVNNQVSPNPVIIVPELTLEDYLEILREFVDHLRTLEPKLNEIETQEIVETLLKINSEPPEPVPCGFEEVILERFSDGVTLRNHDKISRILSFLDVDSLLSLSLASKKTFYAVKVHLNKELYHLPFNKDSICTNLIFWIEGIDFFFKSTGTLKPIDRTEYQPISKHLNTVKSMFPVPNDSMSSQVHVTIDCLQPHYIVYCNHSNPMSHTCSSSNALDWDNNATTKIITCSEFISEYKQRLQVRDDQLVWSFNPNNINPKSLCLLLKHYLETLSECILNHDGQIEFRRTELISSAKHGLVHRIWVQLSLKWDFRFGPRPQNTLYLTIADHFRLDT